MLVLKVMDDCFAEMMKSGPGRTDHFASSSAILHAG
jgi:hypothetical protein